ncbi:MAG: helix-turn-helix transcriptional regulator [Peptococcaceae bacterium]|jgi:transcriptional regulator with XRE-family HTH domain|nr:helix-turn-helix transcriptional regulator [Peptococcaceae bacterium]
MVDSQKIGQFILEKRKALGYTQQQLAELLGVTNKAVSKWETGEGLPDISLFPVISEVLGVSVDELLRGSMAVADCAELGGSLPEADGVTLHRYQLARQIEKFKKHCLVALFISLLGTICFGIVWLEQQDYYSFGIGLIAQALSVCLFMGACWSLQFEVKAYQALYPEERVDGKSLQLKFFCLLLIFWSVVPLILLDMWAMWLVPWVRSSLVDILFFVAGFGLIALFLLWRFHKA